MSFKNIKEVFDNALSHLTVDEAFLKDVSQYGKYFVNKNDEHVQFFGSNLLGVHAVRFLPEDRLNWTVDLLDIDEYETRRNVVKLPTVNETWIRGTDVMNISCLYLVHRVFNSDLSPKLKEQGMMDILLVMHYKLISSLMAHNFKYPTDEATAMAVYAALSKKYALKAYGSWHAVFVARCKDIIDRKSIHMRTIDKFNDDGAIQYMITDIQGRLKSMVKNLNKVFYDIRTQNAKILTVSGRVQLADGAVVRDMQRNLPPFKRYIHEVVLDKPRFIKTELVQVISSMMPTMAEKLLFDALFALHDKCSKNDKSALKLIDETMLHAFQHLGSDKAITGRTPDVGEIVSKLRGLYTASRSTDPVLQVMRDIASDLVKKNVKTKNESMIAAVRTGLLLYIVLRAFSKGYYG